MSIDNLRRTERVAAELRRQRLATTYGDDVLAFYLTLWHAWKALSRQFQTLSANELQLGLVSTPIANQSPPSSSNPPATTTPSFTDELFPTDIDIDPSPVETPLGSAVLPSFQSATRDRRYRRAQRQKMLKAKCGPSLKFPCPYPLCGDRKLSRSGFLDHA